MRACNGVTYSGLLVATALHGCEAVAASACPGCPAVSQVEGVF